MLKRMGLIRVVGALALVAACDKGKVEPAKGSAGSAQPPVPVPAVIDAESIDEQLLNNTYKDDDHVYVRVCNDTGKTMTAIEWHESYKATGIATGTCTGYELAGHPYSYTYAKFNLGKDEFIIQPIDFVGELPLDAGHWSYHVTIIDYGHRTADIRARKERGDGSGPPGTLRVRACNVWKGDFTSSEVSGVTLPNNGALKVKECSPYTEVNRALDRVDATIVVGGDRYVIKPADYEGATSLAAGDWSYRIRIVDPTKHIADVVAELDKP
jgi:hypothetical protein